MFFHSSSFLVIFFYPPDRPPNERTNRLRQRGRSPQRAGGRPGQVGRGQAQGPALRGDAWLSRGVLIRHVRTTENRESR